MDEIINSTFIIVDKHVDGVIILYSGTEEDVDRCLPIYRELCEGICEVYKIDATHLDIEALKNNPELAEQTLQGLMSNY